MATPEEEQRILSQKDVQSEESNTKDTSNVKDKLKGILLAFLMTLEYGASTVCVVLLDRQIPDFELNLIRVGISLIFVSLGLLFTKQLPRVPRSEIIGVFLYSVFALVSTLTYFVAVSLVPLSYFKSIYFTSSIIGGLILYPKCLGEKTALMNIFFAALSIVGVICSIQPEFIFTWKRKLNQVSFEAHYNSTESVNGSTLNLESNDTDTQFQIKTMVGCSLAVVSGLGEDLLIILLKKKPYLQSNVLILMFWTLTFATLISLLVMAVIEKPVALSNLIEVFFVTVHSLTFILGALLLIMATKYISGNTYNIICSTLVMTMLIPQYTLLKHILPGNRNWIEVLGTVLVFIGATTGSIREIMKGDNIHSNI